MRNNITYYRIDDNIEYIYYHSSKQSYPMHTHANHITFGYILDGVVCIICDGKKCLYHAGEHFCIMPDTLHAVYTVNDTAYSMISICVSYDKIQDESEHESTCLKKLKKIISDTPENVLRIENMARSIGLSPYHPV